jgi:hypothetical protein
MKPDVLYLNSSSRALQSVADLAFQHNPPPVLPVYGHRTRIAYSIYLRILFSLISPSFLRSSSFSLSSIRVVTFFSGFLQISILSIRLYHPNLSDFINFTILAHRNLSLTPYLFLFSSFLLLCDNKLFLHSPFRIPLRTFISSKVNDQASALYDFMSLCC